MAKRFTATEKWADSWFLSLTPMQRLGWLYLCDVCDCAGIVDLNRKLADFLVGDTLDWDELIEAAGERIARLSNDKLWLSRFISFQYGELSVDCVPHRAVLQNLGKYANTETIIQEYIKGCPTLKDKDKDKTRKGIAKGKPRIESQDIPVPEGWNTGDMLKAIQDWLAFKAKRGESYKDASYLGRKIAEFGSPAAFVAAVNSSIGNNYSGLFAVKDSTKAGKPDAKPPSPPRYKLTAENFASMEEAGVFVETERSRSKPEHIRATHKDGTLWECLLYPLPDPARP